MKLHFYWFLRWQLFGVSERWSIGDPSEGSRFDQRDEWWKNDVSGVCDGMKSQEELLEGYRWDTFGRSIVTEVCSSRNASKESNPSVWTIYNFATFCFFVFVSLWPFILFLSLDCLNSNGSMDRFQRLLEEKNVLSSLPSKGVERDSTRVRKETFREEGFGIWTSRISMSNASCIRRRGSTVVPLIVLLRPRHLRN